MAAEALAPTVSASHATLDHFSACMAGALAQDVWSAGALALTVWPRNSGHVPRKACAGGLAAWTESGIEQGPC